MILLSSPKRRQATTTQKATKKATATRQTTFKKCDKKRDKSVTRDNELKRG